MVGGPQEGRNGKEGTPCRDSRAHEPLTALTLSRRELHPEPQVRGWHTPEWHTAHILGYYAHRAAPLEFC